jgi:ATP-dependent exoDNAse (exonuclease V) alpha subunit
MTQDKALEILKSGKNVFLTGEPGSGKSYTVNLFTAWLEDNYKKYAVTASTGIAATHINGMTIHSWAALGIKELITAQHIEDILDNKPFVVRKLENAEVLIIDEVSMLSAQVIDNVDKILRGVRKIAKPFGGLQMVFVGDFFQLPPVVKDGKKVKFAFDSEAWKAAAPIICYLTEQHRQSDALFLEILTAMRSGNVTEAHKKALSHKPDIEPETKLFTHNVEVDRINLEELEKIEGKERTYAMTDSGVPFLVQMLKKSCMSPELLRLRVGATVMFTRNNFDEEYVNGTLGKVVELEERHIKVETKDGRTIDVDRATWEIDGGKAEIHQYPLRLAWAITVHKSQGMSLDEARMDLSKCFEFGQGYVAISRVRTLAGLHIEGINDMAFEMHPEVVEADKLFRKQSALVDERPR